MDIILIAFLTALGYIIIIMKLFGLRHLVKRQVIYDALFTFGLPFLFIGTYSGMAVAAISGLIFSGMAYTLGWIMSFDRSKT